MLKRVEVIVEGVVQGVGFRYFTKKIAKELGVRGFVKNLPDGRVFIVAEGNGNVIEKFLTRIGEGPKLAIVKNVHVKELPATGEFKDFEIVY